ncbi:methyltransferase family protein [Dyella subtropica]|uniref:methyltransferase family protein n=1 Tax=Dyella subtropica TaxID=2992127 RepID=UPI002257BEC8|nr:isoprenylcysteine carboxylmethyltransferase family protein [Dyella subtropica]
MIKHIIQNITFNAIFILLLFVPAGTLAWPQGWIFLILFDGCSIATGIWLSKVDPALLAARMKSPFSPEQRPHDRRIMAALMVVFCAWPAFMGLDARGLGWSHTPLWAQAIGAVLILIGFWAWSRVLRANSFAAVTIQLQPERGQTVISTGPYAYVRHPMYAFTLFLLVGAPLLLGSLWGLMGIVVTMPLMALRALGEEAMLMDGLPGYRAYAEKVRYRFVPGIW